MSDPTTNTPSRQLDYLPRPHFEGLHNRTERWACIVAHRRAGKTVAAVYELVIRALMTQKTDARYAYVAPFRQQGKDVAWQYLKRAAEPFIKSPKDVRESELRVKLFNGSWVTIYGADNPDALRGLYLDGAVLDEVGDMRPETWHEVVLPALSDRQGWALFIGTPKGHNMFYRVYEQSTTDPNWFSLTLKASATNILSQDDLDQLRAQMDEHQYAQELECSFDAPVVGTYYADLLQQLAPTHLHDDLYDPERPVFAALDLGYKDQTAVWFWQTAPDRQIRVIDYYSDAQRPIAYYMDHLAALPYEYESLWLPHDGFAKSLQTGMATVEQIQEYMDAHRQRFRDTAINKVPTLRVQQGIDAVRRGLPSTHFDKDKTEAGREALAAYRRTFDEKNKVFSKTPKHDWASDPADGFRYAILAAGSLGHVGSNVYTLGDSTAKPDPTPIGTLQVSLDQLHTERDQDSNVLNFAKRRRTAR